MGNPYEAGKRDGRRVASELDLTDHHVEGIIKSINKFTKIISYLDKKELMQYIDGLASGIRKEIQTKKYR